MIFYPKYSGKAENQNSVHPATQKYYHAVRRMMAILPDYSESGKELKEKIKKEYEDAMKYFESLKV